MNVTISPTVGEILEALELTLADMPDDFGFVLHERIDLSGNIDDDETVDNAISTGKVIPPEEAELHSLLDPLVVQELAAAIRREDRDESELLLDRLIGDDLQVKEWVQMGRYSRKARKSAPALRKAA